MKLNIDSLLEEERLNRLCKVYRLFSGNNVTEEVKTYPKAVAGAPALRKVFSYKVDGTLESEYCEAVYWTEEMESSVGSGATPGYNALNIVKNTITTTSSQLVFPDVGDSFQIFHQELNGVIYFGDEDVDNTYPALFDGAVLEVSGKSDFNLYALTETGTITVFIMTLEKE